MRQCRVLKDALKAFIWAECISKTEKLEINKSVLTFDGCRPHSLTFGYC